MWLYGVFNVLGGLIYGWSAVGLNTGVGLLWRCWYDIADDTSTNTWLIAVLQAAVNVGAMAGALGGGVVVARYGHRVPTIVGGGLSLGAFLSCGMPSYGWQLVARILTGGGIGLVSVTCPSYVASNAPARNRGALGSLFQVAITLAIFGANIAAYIALGPHRDEDSQNYCAAITDHQMRNFAIMAPGGVISFCLVVAAFLGMQEETSQPKKGQDETGDESLLERRGASDLLQYPKALVTGIVMSMSLQLTGINAVMFYAPKFFEAANYEHKILGSCIVMFWNFVTTLICLGLVDRLGRRALLLPSMYSLSLAILLMAPVYTYTESTSVKGALSFVLLGIYIAGFEIGPGSLFWPVCNEIFPEDISSVAFSLCNTLTWILTLAITFTFPPLQSALDNGVFYIYGIPGLLLSSYLLLCLPETKGKTREAVTVELQQPGWIRWPRSGYVRVE